MTSSLSIVISPSKTLSKRSLKKYKLTQRRQNSTKFARMKIQSMQEKNIVHIILQRQCQVLSYSWKQKCPRTQTHGSTAISITMNTPTVLLVCHLLDSYSTDRYHLQATRILSVLLKLNIEVLRMECRCSSQATQLIISK